MQFLIISMVIYAIFNAVLIAYLFKKVKLHQELIDHFFVMESRQVKLNSTISENTSILFNHYREINERVKELEFDA